MEDRIYIKENQTSTGSGNRTMMILGVLAVALIAIGLGGILFFLNSGDENGGNDSTDQETEADADVEDTEDSDPIDTDETPDDTDEDDTTDEDTDTTPPVSPDNYQYAAPTDATQMHIYFPKSPETTTGGKLRPVIRTKPTDKNLVVYALTEIITGPSTEEKAQGFSRPWSVGGESKCDKKVTFKFEVVSGVMRVTFCKDVTSSSIAQFVESVQQSVKEVGNVSKVAVLDAQGNCIGLAAGDKSCLN